MDVSKDGEPVHLGTRPSWADQSTGKLSLSNALANAVEPNNSGAGHTVRTESPFGSGASNGISSGELDSHGLLGSLVDSVLIAGRNVDFTRIDFAEQRDVIERLLD